jgi:hypothetical protein
VSLDILGRDHGGRDFESHIPVTNLVSWDVSRPEFDARQSPLRSLLLYSRSLLLIVGLFCFLAGLFCFDAGSPLLRILRGSNWHGKSLVFFF